MTNNKPLHKIRRTHIQQLLSYADWAFEDGTYYGNKAQFIKRHKELISWLKDLRENEYLRR